MRSEIRIAGVDDAPFDKFSETENLVVATIYRGGNFMDGLLSTTVAVDGDDATDKLAEMFKCKFKRQLRCILLDGIALAGFNVVDIKRLYHKTKIPVMVVMRKLPDMDKMKNALKKIDSLEKMKVIEKAGKIHAVGKIYVQLAGLNPKEAEEILEICCVRANVPEPIRLAHIIASGIKIGESKGGA